MANSKKNDKGDAEPRFRLRRFDTVEAQPVPWCWYPIIPLGRLVYAFGPPGVGKTTLMLALSALVSRGSPMPTITDADGAILEPDEPMPPVCGGVIYLSMEDDAKTTLKPRLARLGADCSKIAFIEGEEGEPADIDIINDYEFLDDFVKDMDARLWILDPAQSYSKGLDMNRADHMRRFTNALTRIAANNNCTVVILSHMTKGTAGGKDLYRGLGSVDLTAAARSVISVEEDENDSSVHVIRHIKSNLAPKAPPVAFRVTADQRVEFLESYDENAATSYVGDEDGEDEPAPAEDGMAPRDRAKKIIRDLLDGGAQTPKTIDYVCGLVGISKSTVSRALRDLRTEDGVEFDRKLNVYTSAEIT